MPKRREQLLLQPGDGECVLSWWFETGIMRCSCNYVERGVNGDVSEAIWEEKERRRGCPSLRRRLT